MSDIAVIIPFYQRDLCILTRAIDSVCAQRIRADDRIEIVVIDDASPLPAKDELARSVTPPHVKLTLIEQKNGGPGAARNSGLRHVQAGRAEYVAFLDSDDIWRPDHLLEALAALENGYEFYFCENRRSGFFDAYAELVPCLRNAGAEIAGRATILDSCGPVLGFAPHSLDTEFVEHPLCHTSSVVMKRDAAVAQRFDADLRNAAEDWMYWLDVAHSGASIAISWKINTEAGEGVNIFFSAFDWNAPATLSRIACQLLFFEKLKDKVCNNSCQYRIASKRAAIYRRAYGFLLMRNFLCGRMPNLSLLRRVIKTNRWTLLSTPFYFLSVLFDRDDKQKQW